MAAPALPPSVSAPDAARAQRPGRAGDGFFHIVRHQQRVVPARWMYLVKVPLVVWRVRASSAPKGSSSIRICGWATVPRGNGDPLGRIPPETARQRVGEFSLSCTRSSISSARWRFSAWLELFIRRDRASRCRSLSHAETGAAPEIRCRALPTPVTGSPLMRISPRSLDSSVLPGIRSSERRFTAQSLLPTSATSSSPAAISEAEFCSAVTCCRGFTHVAKRDQS